MPAVRPFVLVFGDKMVWETFTFQPTRTQLVNAAGHTLTGVNLCTQLECGLPVSAYAFLDRL